MLEYIFNKANLIEREGDLKKIIQYINFQPIKFTDAKLVDKECPLYFKSCFLLLHCSFSATVPLTKHLVWALLQNICSRFAV